MQQSPIPRKLLLILFVSILPLSVQGDILGIFSFTGAEDGTHSGFPVENAFPNIEWSPLTSDFTDIGVVSGFAAFAPYENEPFASYAFDGKGYEVGFDILGPGSNPGISGDPTRAAREGYLEFSLQSSPGFALDIRSISIDFGTDFTAAYSPSVYYNLFYSINGTHWYQIGDASQATSNSDVYKIRDNVTKEFVEDPEAEASFSGVERLYFRLVFADGLSGSDQKRLFVDDIRINGFIEEAPSGGYKGLAYKLGGWMYFYDISTWVWVANNPSLYNFNSSETNSFVEIEADGFVFIESSWIYTYSLETFLWINDDIMLWDSLIDDFVIITP